MSKLYLLFKRDYISLKPVHYDLIKKMSLLSLPNLKIDLTTIDKYKSGSNLPLFVVGRSKIRFGHTEVN